MAIGLNIQFKELKESMQTISIGLLFITPICFCDLVLFSREFYKANPIYISAIVSFCISIGWYFLSILVYAFSVYKKTIKDNGNKILNASTVLSVFFLTLFTYIGYEIDIEFKMYFRGVLCISILTILVYAIKRSSSNGNVNNETQERETAPKN